MLGLGLRSQLAYESDYNQISDWAFQLYNDPDVDFDDDVSQVIMKLVAMQEGPEFILSKEELELMAQELIKE